MMGSLIVLLLLIQIKHLIVDWVWQPLFECENKHIYAHWGGVRHALKNAVGTALVFSLVLAYLGDPRTTSVYFFVLIMDFLIHYHIDWAKMNLNRHWALAPDKCMQFWWLLGFDQFMHQITYIFLIWLVFN